MRVALFLLILMASAICSCSNEGETLPTFRLTTLDGKEITQETLHNKITVINVWATWCGNCLNELDEMNALSAKYKGDDSVLLIAVADEPSNKIEAFLKRREFDFTHIAEGNALTDAIQTRLVKTYPQQIVLDQNLKIAFEHTGEMHDAVAELSLEIERLR